MTSYSVAICNAILASHVIGHLVTFKFPAVRNQTSLSNCNSKGQDAILGLNIRNFIARNF